MKEKRINWCIVDVRSSWKNFGHKLATKANNGKLGMNVFNIADIANLGVVE
jgi:hypothetical protein